MSERIPHIEVVLPIFNEVKNILPLIKQVDEAAKHLKQRARISYLFVNDGSNDGSRELLHRIYRDREDVRIVDFVHNFGHAAALTAGLEHFDGDAALFMDADLQDDPRALVPMFDAWRKGAKTVVAERGERGETLGFLFKAFYFLLHKTAPKLPPLNFGTHCLIDRTVVERMRLLREKHRYFPGLVSYSSTNIYGIRFDRQDRMHGNSRVGLVGLVNLAVTALLSFSSSPVRLVSAIGLCCSAGAFTGGITIICVKLFTPWAIPGWASMMTSIAFASGLQLLCLGILGEYVARIYDEVKQRPLYLVDRVLERRKRGTSSRKDAA